MSNYNTQLQSNNADLQTVLQTLQNKATSGLELNFEVVGGTTQPSNPTENMIWVNTDIEISSWAFSATEPNDPTNGMVWIGTSDVSGVSFNALKENDIQVYPLFAKQYINGAWVIANIKTYQGGVWVDWKRHLFNNGDQCIGLTNGWARSGIRMDSGHPNSGTINIGDVISLSSVSYGSSNGTTAAVSTVNPINLTNVRSIFFKGKATSTAVTCFITTANSNSSWTDGVVVATIENRSATTDIVELPVETYSGEYYVNIAVFRGRTGEVSEIWMT